jgi:diguanylate cyclase (GGDEF)-like protein
MIKQYILWNWGMILILAAFAVSLKETVFLDKTTIRRMYILIVAVFLLSLVVFAEFYLTDLGGHAKARLVLMAVRYSATPFILAMVIFTLVKELRWFIFLPAMGLAVINVLSIFNGLVFSIGADGVFRRGPLGYLPFIMVGLYCVFLIYILIKRSNKQVLEIIPIAFLGFSFASGLVLPFIYGRDYSHIFCTTIAIALYVYYVFSILKLTKVDALTGLLNRQAYYADISSDPEEITAVVSVDMNGLKAINDNGGHKAGDEALTALAMCILRARKRNQLCYRLGGDEFVIICRKTSQAEMLQLVENLKKQVAETKYSCSIGCSHLDDGAASVDDLLQRSDSMMYAEKAAYYRNSGRDRRHRREPSAEG